MSTLQFANTHNLVAFLSKPTESDGFEQIVVFLNAHPIREAQLHAKVDGKKIIVTESSVRRDLRLAYEEDEAVHKELGDRLVRAATTAFSLEAEQDNELNADINWNAVMEQVKRSESEIRPLFEKHYNYNQAFLEEVNEEVTVPEKKRNLKSHLQIVTNDDDDVYTEATPLASKIPIADYKIHFERNKPYFKIIKADGNHMLFLSFSALLKNFNREDLESLWKLVKERFEKTEPKNYCDDYLLKTLKIMFEQPNVEASV
nr:hypothetical protein [Tanacetum cinerariifolium]